MKASTERKIIRWFHILASIPLIGFIYGPVSQIPEAVTALKWVIFPLIVLSGLWLWKGTAVRKWVKRQRLSNQQYPFLIN
jgi:thiosulfate reductase cytochrome b subunit